MDNNKQTPQRNLDELKQQIDLVAYAENKGYEIDKDKSTSKHVNMYKMDDQGEKETIVIYRDNKSGHDGYFNAADTRDKGTVIDFERNRNQEGWKGVFKALDEYLMSNRKSDVERQPEQEPRREKIVNNEFQFKPLTDTTYLESRGLTKDTVAAPEFSGRVLNKEYTTPDKKTYINTAFPLRNEQGTVAADIRNEGYKTVENARADAVWLSNTNHKPGKVDKLVVTESPIDSMSYHQLKPPSQDEKRVYLATAGGVGTGHKRLIQIVNDNLEPKQIVLANDNDAGGFRNNINILGALRHKDSPESQQVQIQLGQQTRSNVILTISINHANEQEGQQKVKSISERFREAFNKNIPPEVEKEKDYFMKINISGKNVSEIEVHFANTRDNLTQAQQVSIHIKGLQNVVKLDKPFTKDFNEDLVKNVKHVDSQVKLSSTAEAKPARELEPAPTIGSRLGTVMVGSENNSVLKKKL